MRSTQEVESQAVTIPPFAGCIEAADEMDSAGVGCLVVVENDGRPVGILTDRDLTRRVVAAGRDPEKTTVGDVMTPDPVTGARHAHIVELLELMGRHRIRRLPLVEDGRVTGLLSLDDLVLGVSSHLYNVSEAVWVGLRDSRHSARRRRRQESREDLLDDLRELVSGLTGRARESAAAGLRELSDRLAGKD